MNKIKDNINRLGQSLIQKPVSIAPLAIFRVFFGAVMLVSVIRFLVNGWVESLYLNPDFHFSYYGFSWVQPFDALGMYGLFAIMALSTILIMLGLWYRPATIIFFFAFTYVELIDKTYYLNHYYFISLVSFLLIFLPAHRYFSLDVIRKPQIRLMQVPVWMVNILRLQLGIVYVHAGIAKINYDWLFRAMPMRTWLAAHQHWPLVGNLLAKPATAFLASWFGALYDLGIAFLFLIRKYRWFAYALVIIFHGLTALLFQIGMFPYIMIGATLIFFSPTFHDKLIDKISNTWNQIFSRKTLKADEQGSIPVFANPFWKKTVGGLMVLFIAFQLIWPWRFTLYPGNLLWTHEGYRFSWRVMLTQKAGTTFFNVKNPKNGQSKEVELKKHLTPFQEKIMATQPDMILQFAHYLENHYKAKGIENPVITAESYVDLNRRGSQRFIDPTVNLANCEPGYHHKDWILPRKSKQDKALTQKGRR